MERGSAFGAYLAPARRRPQFWRLLAGIAICVLVFLVWILIMGGAALVLLGAQGAQAVMLGMADPTAPLPTLMLLASFVGMALGPAVAVRILHKRTFGTLLGPTGRFLREAAIAMAAVAMLYGAGLFLWRGTFDSVPNLPPGMWLMLLPLSLLGVGVQTLAEEILFRGYLMQQLAVRVGSPLVYMLIPSLCFGILHYDTATMGSNAWAVVGSTAFFGLIAADLTRATGSLGAAWGLHLANNVVAILLVATQGTITGLALRVTPYAASDVQITGPLLIVDMVLLVLVWAILRGLLRR